MWKDVSESKGEGDMNNPLDLVIEENKHLKKVIKMQESMISSYENVVYNLLDLLEKYEPKQVSKLRKLFAEEGKNP